MLKYSQSLLAVGSVFCLNLIIYFRAIATIEPADMVFAECARNSGRTSAALNLIILIMLGHFGLNAIFKDKSKYKWLVLFSVLFAINHLTHFFFVTQFFKDQLWELKIYPNLREVITYIFIVFIPFLLGYLKRLNKILYLLTICHFLNVTYIIGITFYGRIKPIDPAYMHQIGVLVMIVAVGYFLYRVVKERYLFKFY